MAKKKITHEKTCPACGGNGKSYGPRYCRRCKGRTTVRETVIVEDVDKKSTTEFEREVASALNGFGDQMRSALKEAMRELEDRDS